MDAARVEVLHRELVLALHHANHGERVGKVRVLVDSTLDQEPATLKPLIGGPPANHRVFDHRMGHLDRPVANQGLERLQLRLRVDLVHKHSFVRVSGRLPWSLGWTVPLPMRRSSAAEVDTQPSNVVPTVLVVTSARASLSYASGICQPTRFRGNALTPECRRCRSPVSVARSRASLLVPPGLRS
jgi:hypothetical protein